MKAKCEGKVEGAQSKVSHCKSTRPYLKIKQDFSFFLGIGHIPSLLAIKHSL
jgi:hypothetical protein